VRKGTLAKFNVPAGRVGQATRTAQGLGLHPMHGLVNGLFNFQFNLVRQLGALGGKELDAVVVIRVVRGRDHDTGRQAQGTCQIRYSGRRYRACQQYIDPGSRQTGFQRRFQHVAGNTGVLANHHGGAAGTFILGSQNLASSITQAQGELGVNGWATYFTADTIGAEILTIAHSETPHSTAFHTSSASRMAATSWTRTIFAPRATQARAADRLPIKRSLAGFPVTWPIMDLRDKPISQG